MIIIEQIQAISLETWLVWVTIVFGLKWLLDLAKLEPDFQEKQAERENLWIKQSRGKPPNQKIM